MWFAFFTVIAFNYLGISSFLCIFFGSSDKILLVIGLYTTSLFSSVAIFSIVDLWKL